MPDTTSELAAHGAQPTALMIDARDVRKRFGTHEVLRGVSLSVARGEVVAVIGPSGSGKSTFLRCLNHLETIDSGHIAIEGETLVSTDSQGRSHYAPEAQVRRICARTGMVFQHFNLFGHLTVLENLIEAPLVVQRTPRQTAIARAEQLLAKVGMAPYFADHVYSGHEMPRSKPFPDVYLAAAKALNADPAKCLVIEDTMTGVQAGVAAGATVWGYFPADQGHATAEQLLEAGAACVFGDMGDLPAMFDAVRRSAASASAGDVDEHDLR